MRGFLSDDGDVRIGRWAEALCELGDLRRDDVNAWLSGEGGIYLDHCADVWRDVRDGVAPPERFSESFEAAILTLVQSGGWEEDLREAISDVDFRDITNTLFGYWGESEDDLFEVIGIGDLDDFETESLEALGDLEYEESA